MPSTAALHESGHVIIGQILGVDVLSARVDGYDGETLIGPVHNIDTDSIIMMLLSGWAAAELDPNVPAHELQHGASGDLAYVRMLLRGDLAFDAEGRWLGFPSDGALEAELGRCRVVAQRLVRVHRQRILDLSERLDAEGNVDFGGADA